MLNVLSEEWYLEQMKSMMGEHVEREESDKVEELVEVSFDDIKWQRMMSLVLEE